MIKTIDTVDTITKFCISIVDTLDRKSWEVKSHLDFLKYTQGI